MSWQSVKTAIESSKTVLEIFAIFVGGFWVYQNYVESDVPALELRASVNSELSWEQKTPESCLAEYTVTFKNIGKRSIDLEEQPTVSVWLRDLSSGTGQVQYLNPHDLMSGDPIQKAKLQSGDFNYHYPPDVQDTVTITFSVPNKPKEIGIFYIQFNPPKSFPLRWHEKLLKFLHILSIETPEGWSDYRWGFLCVDDSKEKDTPEQSDNIIKKKG